MNYKEFCLSCESHAESLRKEGLICIAECKNYEAYNWICCTFMTDKFGGVACEVKILDGKIIFTDFKKQIECASLELALLLVKGPIVKEMQSRNLTEIANFINAENDD